MILAHAELELGNISESEDYFRMAIRISPQLAGAYKGLGKIHMIREDYELAMKCYKKALDLDESDISTLNSMGLAYVKLERYVDGIEKYQAALKIEPNDSRILFNLGFALEKIGKVDQARSYYQRALDVCPEFEKAARKTKKPLSLALLPHHNIP